MPKSQHPQFNYELRSGDCGPDTGHYHSFGEVRGPMIPGGYSASAAPYPTRQAARQQMRSKIGHVATVGYPENHCPICPKSAPRLQLDATLAPSAHTPPQPRRRPAFAKDTPLHPKSHSDAATPPRYGANRAGSHRTGTAAP